MAKCLCVLCVHLLQEDKSVVWLRESLDLEIKLKNISRPTHNCCAQSHASEIRPECKGVDLNFLNVFLLCCGPASLIPNLVEVTRFIMQLDFLSAVFVASCISNRTLVTVTNWVTTIKPFDSS